ncbi:MAG TPA: DUF309 domain-containing protein [Limnochordia bacterium]|nr:DUF309 domain-containing protein [Limnochordia bacterium]
MTAHDGSTFPAALIEFVELFNAERFWESHEVLEQPWRSNRSRFYQGLILMASAYVHVQRGNPIGVRKQLLKTRRRLAGLPKSYLGIDLARIDHESERLLRIVESPHAPTGTALQRSVRFLRLSLDRELIRGDEPELVGVR